MMRPLLIALLTVLSALPARAAFETTAEAAFVLDVTTDTVLLEKNADEPLPPASMSKLMTLYMLFEALRDGRVTMDTQFAVSTKARQMGGSSMFLNENDRPTVEQLIQGIIVQSGNDACVVVAEGLAGSEQAFARLMNERADRLGLTDSHFVNSTGWPAQGHEMSMADLGRLSALLVTEFPEYYGYFAQQEYAFDGRVPTNHRNRNPLLGLGIGADGLKTGHTQEAGYGLAGSAVQGDRRIVFVVTGLDSEAQRAEESERIVAWAFRQFVERELAEEGDALAQAAVWMGNLQMVDLVAPHDLTLLVPSTQGRSISGEVVFDTPIEAPIAAGDPLGELVVTPEGMATQRFQLVASDDVTRGGFQPRMRSAAQVVLDRIVGEAQALR